MDLRTESIVEWVEVVSVALSLMFDEMLSRSRLNENSYGLFCVMMSGSVMVSGNPHGTTWMEGEKNSAFISDVVAEQERVAEPEGSRACSGTSARW